MEIIIVRHALAEEREDFAKKGLEDQFRPLTLKGRKRMQKICVQMKDFVKDVDVIVTSPFTRAAQTAQILAQHYPGKKILEIPELVPQSPPQALLKWVRTQGRGYKRMMFVGHEPHLSVFACYMLSGKAESFIDLRKSGILSLELETFAQANAGGAELMYSIPPKIFD
ncbi:SixA phosphatase family protein [Bdellovibrio sp. HCB209]|uniref:SixA phosphatase family protein n=1 Tax=Bdellovibrio sp. HCB209 TaxID=3394354 RepID=UPI0039B63708